ncbi:MAG: sigma 54-interacting transcriptional regulator [Candidatus Eisenbacteria bacterium]|nr:sigma 54-interacting transcriptional regulator [Candidatus Eisenbacteria bacterium]
MQWDAGLLEEIFEIVTRAESVDHALPQVLERALRFIGFERGAVYTLDEERRTLHLRAHRGDTGRMARTFQTIPVGQGVIGRVAESGNRALVEDTCRDPRMSTTVLCEEGIRSFLCAPIRARGRVLGVLAVASGEERAFRESHINAASAVAHQLGVALDNAELLLRSRQGERLYRNLLDGSPDLHILCDPDFRVIRINPAVRDFFGLAEGADEITHLRDLLDEEPFNDFRRTRDRLVHGSREGIRFDLELRGADGADHLFDVHSNLIHEEGGEFFLHFIGRDITERKQLESRLLEFTNRLAEMVERRDTQLQKARDQIARLFDVTRRIHELGSIDEKLRLIVETVVEAKLFRKAVVRLHDREGRPLHSTAEGYTTEELSRLQDWHFLPLRLGGETSDGAVRVGASFFLPSDQGGRRPEGRWMQGDRLVIPLAGGESNGPIGYLLVEEPFDGTQPGEETVQVMEMFVTQGARAVLEARMEQQLAEVDRMRTAVARRYRFDRLVGDSPPMRDLYETIRRLAKVRTSVLIVGESGTGKELVAGAIHYNGPRKDAPFIKVNCAAIPESLLESELFGIERRVATGVDRRVGRFERADGGTLFLDEVGDMSYATQAKVLRALQERAFERVGGEKTIRVDVRIVAATNRDLQEEIDRGRFRRDLFYRLNVVNVTLPPLRERTGDVPLLVEHFLSRYSRELNKPGRRVPREMLEHFLRYPWPGNVRQLENCIERALAIGPDEAKELRWEDLPPVIRDWSDGHSGGEGERGEDLNLKRNMDRLEEHLVLEALQRSGGVQKRASLLLGISERAMWYRVKKLQKKRGE